MTPQDGAVPSGASGTTASTILATGPRPAAPVTPSATYVGVLPPPRPITPADIHALLASSDSAAYAADLLWLLQPGAPVFDGISAVAEEVAARDPFLGGTLRALCLEMGWGRSANPDAAWVEYEKLAAAGCRVAEIFVSSALMNTKDTPSEAVDRLQALLDAGSGQAGLMLGIHWTALGREEEAVAALRRATDLGNAPAAHLFGSRLWKGIGVVKDVEAGLACWLRAADGRNPQAMVDIGIALESGFAGASPDPRQAVAWFEAAAAIGYADASTRAAWALWKLGDADRAAPHARASAAAGSAMGHYLLGLMMRDGRGCVPDLTGALVQFEAAARDGVGGAMVAAGRMLLAGRGCSADAARAAGWFRKAAEIGDSVGMFEWGRVLLDGSGVPADPPVAEDWLRKAAASGSAPAAERLGSRLMDRVGCLDEAVELLRKAASAGQAVAAVHLGYCLLPRKAETAIAQEIFSSFCVGSESQNSFGMFMRGIAHFQGIGTPQDDVAAFAWFLQAAQAGNPQAMERAGFCLRNGIGTNKDAIGAMKWLYEASKGGDAIGSRNLAQMLDENHPSRWKGTPSNALEAFEMAAAQSTNNDQRAETAGAMVNSRTSDVSAAGSRLLDKLASSGLASDLARAGRAAAATRFSERGAEWLRKAVELGEVEAAHVLAVAIREGRIATRDPEEASRLLRWAASCGYGPSKRTLESRVVHPLAPDARFAKLDAMIGLDPVKRKLRDVAYALQLDTTRRSKGYKGGSPAPAHLAFLGNPGTGKTTVAREVGDIYRSIGRLAKGHVVEVKRADLVGRYIGETEANTRAAFDRASDGVLFVDEAYELSMGDSARDFGVKALGVLLTEMENRRDRVVVIVAGYIDQMEGFFDSNPGLPSRIPADNRIVFPDYEPEELMRIFDRTALEEQYRVTEAARDAARQWCQGAKAAAGKRFGNARDIRDLLWAGAKQNMGRRLYSPGAQNGGDIGLITIDDIPRLA